MSHNQSRGDKNEPPKYRRSGRSGNSASQKNFSGEGGGSGKGGGTKAPPSSSSSTSSSSLPTNRGGKKANNAQGGQSKASGSKVKSNVNANANVDAKLDSGSSAAARAIQNGAHSQPPLRADSPESIASVKPTDTESQKINRGVPKAPASNVAASHPDAMAPATPSKGDPSRSFPLQFGSISHGLRNGMQVPAQTNSAHPNLDEQKCHQQLPKKDAGAVDQSTITEPRPIPKAKRAIHVAPPPAAQMQKPSGHPFPGISVPMPFHQPQLPVKFGGPNPQMQSQGIVNSSMPMSIPIPLPMGNPPHMQQHVFVPGIQPHPMQPQGIMHQGHSLNFSSQMGPPLAPHLGNMGISLGPQFQHHHHQQAGKYGASRKNVKITHPDTHEELRLDRTDAYGDSGPSIPRSHPNMPSQSQPIPSYPPAHTMNYFPNSYNASSVYFPAPGSVPLTSPQLPASFQAPRFYNQVTAKPSASSHGDKALTSDDTVSGFERNFSGLVSPSALGSKDKLAELNRLKSIASRAKKKKKGMLQKADAQGTTSDLYMAYKGPEEKREAPASAERTESSSSITLKQVSADASEGDVISNEKCAHSKPEPDDWEDAADISTPKLDTLHDGKKVSQELKLHGKDENEGMTKKYSRDFLLKFVAFKISLDVAESNFSGLVSPSALGSKDKPAELNRAKSTTSRGKKKKKEILQKADAQGTTSALGSKDKPAELNREKSTTSREKKKEKGYATPDDWEDAADIFTPKLDTLHDGKKVSQVLKLHGKDENEGKTKKYSRDFLLKFVDFNKIPSDVAESNFSGLVSPSALGSKDKPAELNRAKSTTSRAKKKKKEMLQKADAQGTTSVYMAYKGPEGKKEKKKARSSFSISLMQVSSDDSEGDVLSNEKCAHSKPEPDGWEDAADISTPKLDTLHDGKKVYQGFPSDLAEALSPSNVNVSWESYPSPGRAVDGPAGGPRLDQRASFQAEEDKWSKLPGPPAQGRDLRLDIGYGGNVQGFRPGPGGNYGVLSDPRAQTPVQHAGGMLSGPMQSPGPQGGMQRNNVDSDRWGCSSSFHKGLLPFPHSDSFTGDARS